MEMPNLNIVSLPKIEASLIFNLPVLIGFLVLFFIFYSIITSVLMYHWSAYGMKSKSILVAETVFLFVSIVLFVFAGTSLVYF